MQRSKLLVRNISMLRDLLSRRDNISTNLDAVLPIRLAIVENILPACCEERREETTEEAECGELRTGPGGSVDEETSATLPQ